MSAEPLKYRSQAAAERAASRVERDVPSARAVVESDNTLTVYVYEALLTPEQWQVVEPHRHRTPAAPNPKTPLLSPSRKVSAPTELSAVTSPVKVCRDILKEMQAAGGIDDRAAFMKRATPAGVAKNTASTTYRRVRKELGLIGSVQIVRRRARARTTTALKARGRPALGARVCNGIEEPPLGTMSREVWDMADVLHRKFKRVPKRGEVGLRLPDISEATVKTAYPKWRKFHALPNPGQHHERA